MADRDTSRDTSGNMAGNDGPNRRASDTTDRTAGQTPGSRIAGTQSGTGASTGANTGADTQANTGSGGTLGRVGSDVAGQATELGKQALGGAQGRIRGMLEQQTDRAADQLGGVAAALHKAAEHLSDENNRVVAQYVDQAADRVDEMADMIRNSTLDDMLTQVEGFARRQPEVFVGGALALGFLAARFIKSSGEGHRREPDYGPGYGPSAGYPAYGGERGGQRRPGRAGSSRYARSDWQAPETRVRGTAGDVSSSPAGSISRAGTTGPVTRDSGLTGGSTAGNSTASTSTARTRDAADLISGAGAASTSGGPAAASTGKPTGTGPEETLGSSPASTAKPQVAGSLGNAPTTASANTPATGQQGHKP